MKIIKLVLKGYKRFELIGSDTLVYTPSSPYQLILGKNGIGKSSLLNELSPLPPESSDLKELGFKLIELEHRGDTYTLRYDLHKKLNCSFIKNNEELNEGGTIRVQRDLIWKYFNYDDNIHLILIDFTLLTNMSGSQRREWFMRMSSSDMNYAISLFNRLKSAERDIRGAIKLNNQRIVNETAKLGDEETIKQQRELAEQTKQELNFLLTKQDHQIKNTENELHQVYQSLVELSSSIVNMTMRREINDKKTLDELLAFRAQLEYQVKSCQQRYKEVVDKLTELQDIVNKNESIQTKPLSEIDQDLQRCRYLIDQNLQNAEDLGIEVGQLPDKQLFELPRLITAMTQIVSQLPVNHYHDQEKGIRYYSRQRLEAFGDEVNHLRESLLKAKNKLDYLQKTKQNLEDVHDVDCPSCHHRFKPGVECNQIAKLSEEIAKGRVYIEETENRLQRVIEALNEQNKYRNELNKLTDLKDRYSLFNPLFILILKQELVYENPVEIISLMNDYQQALERRCELNRLEQEFQSLNELRAKRLASESVDVGFIRKTVEEYENQLTQLSQEIEQVNQFLTKVNQDIRLTEHLSQQRHQIETLREQLRQFTLNQVKYKNEQALRFILNEKQSTLARSEQYLTEVEQKERIILELTETNKKLAEDQIHLKVLINALSPQDGLIAESLVGFLNMFLDEMRNVLDQIWSYPMHPYMELSEEGIELDYRFKVDIDEGELSVKDVAFLSRGQKEIVNFTFKLLLMQHLNLSDYPLFMDEIGASFDSYHRDKLYQYVKQLVESNQVRQVFIISHIASSHDALIHADRCILDNDRLLTEEKDNQVIRFTLTDA